MNQGHQDTHLQRGPGSLRSALRTEKWPLVAKTRRFRQVPSGNHWTPAKHLPLKIQADNEPPKRFKPTFFYISYAKFIAILGMFLKLFLRSIKTAPIKQFYAAAAKFNSALSYKMSHRKAPSASGLVVGPFPSKTALYGHIWVSRVATAV